MTIEITTTRLFGLHVSKKEAPVGLWDAVRIVEGPYGSSLIRTIEILSPDCMQIVDLWRNIKARDLRAAFIPEHSSVYERDEINQLNLLSLDHDYFLGRLVGYKRYSWRP